MEGSAALISIHPNYVEKILSGEKRLEFRRSWAASQVDYLVVYATSPVQQIVSVIQVGQVFRGSKSRLWELARSKGGGISRRKLFAYMEGKNEGVALELSRVLKIAEGINPRIFFGNEFHPPQSFRYLTQSEFAKLVKQLGGKKWE
jgi:predicted transcriptional regulator